MAQATHCSTARASDYRTRRRLEQRAMACRRAVRAAKAVRP